MIRDGVADMIAIGRQALCDPGIPSKLAAGQPETITWCSACDQCSLLLITPQYTGCIRDPYYAKKIPAALEALSHH